MSDAAPPPGNAILPNGGMSEDAGIARPRGDEGAVTEANQAAQPRSEIGGPGDDGPVTEANQEIGAPGNHGNAVWHSRGYLPHFDHAEAIQHVTFHLADSLPRVVVERLDAELNHLPPMKQDVERRKRVSAWLDAGHGCCVLREPEIASMVQDTFMFFDGQRYRLLEWVVMPNHVHVLFQPLHGWAVSKIVASWKKFTARKICDYWRGAGKPGNGSPGNANLLIGGIGKAVKALQAQSDDSGSPEANREIGVPGGPGSGVPAVWHREYWDRYIRHAQHLAQAVDYIRQNPVEAGLVRSAEDWRWGSAHVRLAGNTH